MKGLLFQERGSSVVNDYSRRNLTIFDACTENLPRCNCSIAGTAGAEKPKNFTKKLSPFVCKIIMIVVDSTIRMMDAEHFHERDKTVDNLRKLGAVTWELGQMPNAPKELTLWSFVLTKLECVE